MSCLRFCGMFGPFGDVTLDYSGVCLTYLSLPLVTVHLLTLKLNWGPLRSETRRDDSLPSSNVLSNKGAVPHRLLSNITVTRRRRGDLLTSPERRRVNRLHFED